MKLVENKKIGMTYVITETIQAGMELFGFEVKSLRQKLGSLEGSRVIVRGGEVFLVGSYIPPYQAANTPKSYDPYRTRRLLLTKAEIERLHGTEKAKTLTLVPSSLYLSKNLVKCGVALCKKKNTNDKREDIKRDIARRELRSND